MMSARWIFRVFLITEAREQSLENNRSLCRQNYLNFAAINFGLSKFTFEFHIVFILSAVLILTHSHERSWSRGDTLSYGIWTQNGELYTMHFDSTNTDAIYKRNHCKQWSISVQLMKTIKIHLKQINYQRSTKLIRIIKIWCLR